MNQYRRTSITDLASALQLAPSTVSRALSNHPDISEVTKTRVQQMAEQLQYQPNQLAAALRVGRSRTLGVLVPHITGYFFPEVINGIVTEANQAGYNVMICQSNEDQQQEKKNLDLLMGEQAEGILISLANTTQTFDHFETVRKAQVPLVFFDRIVEGMTGHRISAVVLDDHAGAYQAVSHLIQQGCQRIAHLTGPQHLNIYHNRYQGYCDALRDHGLAVEQELICIGSLTLSSGAADMYQLLRLQQPPDAVFASSDLAAVGALQVLKQLHIRVPGTVALAGFSNEQFTDLTEPTITSVDQCCHEMGQTAVRHLLQMLAGKAPAPLILKPRLLIRDSSRKMALLPPEVKFEYWADS